LALIISFFFFNDTATTEIYTLSLHDALPISWRWLAHTLTADRFRDLLPETADLTVVRHVLPNLRALNFVVEGLLGDGVAARHRFDPQAKAVGEWLRARHLEIPEALL